MSTRRLSIFLLAHTLLLFLALFFSPRATASLLSYTAQFSSSDIQARVDSMKPIKFHKSFISIEMQNPRVSLIAPSNQISLSSSLLIESTFLQSSLDPSKHLSLPARASIQAGLRYEPTEGAFYLLDPKVTSLQVDQIPETIRPKVHELAQALATHFFTKRPVFVLHDDHAKQRLLKSILQSVRVQGDQIIAVFGF
jgi:hypothetical protein